MYFKFFKYFIFVLVLLKMLLKDNYLKLILCGDDLFVYILKFVGLVSYIFIGGILV